MMELMITVVIMGVIAGLAIPAYFSTIEQGRLNEARVNIAIVRMGEMIFANNDAQGRYWPTGGGASTPGDAAINTALSVTITSVYFTISLNVDNTATPKTFTVTATRNNVSGGNGVTTCTINQAGITNGC